MQPSLKIISGKLLIVSDIHGNEYDFKHILKRFELLRAESLVDKLVFLGDVVHSFNYKKDYSIEILDKLIALKANEPNSNVLCLMGNHELVHLLHLPLYKGNWEFNKGLEWKFAKNRDKYIQFLANMPFSLGTESLLINHAGASSIYSLQAEHGQILDYLNDYQGLQEYLKSQTGIDLNKHRSKYKPAVGMDIMKFPIGDVIWDMWFNGNEHQYGESYEEMVADMLNAFSLENKFKFLISGHIGEEAGFKIVNKHNLRICSSAGCPLGLEKKMLIVDAARQYKSMDELKTCLIDTYL